jgi:hypothetical protein
MRLLKSFNGRSHSKKRHSRYEQGVQVRPTASDREFASKLDLMLGDLMECGKAIDLAVFALVRILVV